MGSLNKSLVVRTCNLGASGDWVPTCIRYHLALGIIYINHPQRLCSFWSAESESDFLSMHREFISYSQPILSYFSDLTLSIHNSWPFSVTPGQRSWFLVLTKRSKALGDENKMKQSKLHVHSGPYNAVIQSCRSVWYLEEKHKCQQGWNWSNTHWSSQYWYRISLTGI